MTATSIDGMLLVDKPAGLTSHDVVAIARRAVGAERAGHAGTLDPFATGLLVVLLGRATRLATHVPGEPKVYEATIAFGTETDTDDATGTAVRTAPLPGAHAVEAAQLQLTGQLQQVPPAYSAKQVGGRRAYRAARAGTPLDLAPVTVTVHAWQAMRFEAGTLRATIACSGGTYIRSLARDLGRLAGSAAHLLTLRRMQSGPFHVSDAAPLDAVKAGEARVAPSLAAIPQLRRHHLTPEALGRVRHGGAIPAEMETPGQVVACVAPDGTLAAVAEWRDGRWQPTVVLADA